MWYRCGFDTIKKDGGESSVAGGCSGDWKDRLGFGHSTGTPCFFFFFLNFIFQTQ
jgi:hypothetical protein